MTENERQLIINLTLKKISKDEFLEKYHVNVEIDKEHILHLLMEGLKNKNADDIEYTLLLAFYFGCSKKYTNTLCELILKKWHFQHENIAKMLQKLKDPLSVNYLFKAAMAEYDYLAYDDSNSLAVKCIWALGDINTSSSRDKLTLLANSDTPRIKKSALHQLDRIKEF